MTLIPNGANPPQYSGYSMNEYVFYVGFYKLNDPSEITQPSETLLVADGYSQSLFHDWNDGDVLNGKKVMIVAY